MELIKNKYFIEFLKELRFPLKGIINLSQSITRLIQNAKEVKHKESDIYKNIQNKKENTDNIIIDPSNQNENKPNKKTGPYDVVLKEDKKNLDDIFKIDSKDFNEIKNKLGLLNTLEINFIMIINQVIGFSSESLFIENVDSNENFNFDNNNAISSVINPHYNFLYNNSSFSNNNIVKNNLNNLKNNNNLIINNNINTTSNFNFNNENKNSIYNKNNNLHSFTQNNFKSFFVQENNNNNQISNSNLNYFLRIREDISFYFFNNIEEELLKLIYDFSLNKFVLSEINLYEIIISCYEIIKCININIPNISSFNKTYSDFIDSGFFPKLILSEKIKGYIVKSNDVLFRVILLSIINYCLKIIKTGVIILGVDIVESKSKLLVSISLNDDKKSKGVSELNFNSYKAFEEIKYSNSNFIKRNNTHPDNSNPIPNDNLILENNLNNLNNFNSNNVNTIINSKNLDKENYLEQKKPNHFNHPHLYISKKIAEMLNHNILYESESGKGDSFIIEINYEENIYQMDKSQFDNSEINCSKNEYAIENPYYQDMNKSSNQTNTNNFTSNSIFNSATENTINNSCDNYHNIYGVRKNPQTNQQSITNQSGLNNKNHHPNKNSSFYNSRNQEVKNINNNRVLEFEIEEDSDSDKDKSDIYTKIKSIDQNIINNHVQSKDNTNNNNCYDAYKKRLSSQYSSTRRFSANDNNNRNYFGFKNGIGDETIKNSNQHNILMNQNNLLSKHI